MRCKLFTTVCCFGGADGVCCLLRSVVVCCGVLFVGRCELCVVCCLPVGVVCCCGRMMSFGVAVVVYCCLLSVVGCCCWRCCVLSGHVRGRPLFAAVGGNVSYVGSCLLLFAIICGCLLFVPCWSLLFAAV